MPARPAARHPRNPPACEVNEWAATAHEMRHVLLLVAALALATNPDVVVWVAYRLMLLTMLGIIGWLAVLGQ